MQPDTIITCPSGHSIHAAQLKSHFDLSKKVEEAIIFDCPGGKRGHSFDIYQAVGARIFTIEEAWKLVMAATVQISQKKGVKVGIKS